MNTTIFSRAVIECCAAAQGKAFSVETLKAHYINGTDEGDTFVEQCRLYFCDQFGLPEKTGFATMQKNKVRGASTIYTYAGALRRLYIKGGPDAVLSATARSLVKGKAKQTAKPADGETDAAPVKQGISIDAAVEAIIAAHKAHALAPEHYAALQALIPASAPVKHMGDVVEVGTLALTH